MATTKPQHSIYLHLPIGPSRSSAPTYPEKNHIIQTNRQSVLVFPPTDSTLTHRFASQHHTILTKICTIASRIDVELRSTLPFFVASPRYPPPPFPGSRSKAKPISASRCRFLTTLSVILSLIQTIADTSLRQRSPISTLPWNKRYGSSIRRMALRQVINPMSTEHVPVMSHRLLTGVSVDNFCRPQA